MPETIRLGARGSDVALLQLGLSRAGYYRGALDGIFGGQTREALMEFQRAEGIGADGIAGEESWRGLVPWWMGYIVTKITPGDTYLALSEEYGTTVEAIRTANPGYDGDHLPVGGELVIPLDFSLVDEQVPVSSWYVSTIACGLAARYPYVEKGEYGRSVQGKPLYTLSVGTGARRVHIGAAIHANEWITSLLVLKFLEEYAMALACDGEFAGVRARTLFRECRLVTSPLENPDGVDLVTGAIRQGREFQMARRIAASYPAIPFPSGWKANIQGIDLNLQFPAGWERARAIKYAQGFRSPAPRDFVGNSPLEAPEARSLAELTRREEFARIMACHTQGSVIYWQYGDCEPEGARRIGEGISKITGYPLEPTPAASANAGYKDWFIGTWCRPGYTMEVGLGQSPLPLSDFSEIYRVNKPAMAYFMGARDA
ncbi:MAG: peptidoglycan-binding protein [Clostridia bacterium]|nr:peptidoglycan-binding protein [Clostridia bacterium]